MPKIDVSAVIAARKGGMFNKEGDGVTVSPDELTAYILDPANTPIAGLKLDVLSDSAVLKEMILTMDINGDGKISPDEVYKGFDDLRSAIICLLLMDGRLRTLTPNSFFRHRRCRVVRTMML